MKYDDPSAIDELYPDIDPMDIWHSDNDLKPQYLLDAERAIRNFNHRLSIFLYKHKEEYPKLYERECEKTSTSKLLQLEW